MSVYQRVLGLLVNLPELVEYSHGSYLEETPSFPVKIPGTISEETGENRNSR